MEGSEAQAPSPAESRAREEVWERLWSQIDLSEGFWLGLLAGTDVAWLDELQRRAGQVLRGQARGMQVRDVAAPSDLRDVVDWLLEPRDPSVGLTWVVGVRGDPRAWTEAWTWTLHRLNERRDVLARTLPGGLLITGPPVLLQLVRDEAADLWTSISLMLRLPPPPPGDAVAETAADYAPDRLAEAGEREFAARALQEAVTPSDGMRRPLQAAARALQAGRGDLAVQHARDALDRAGGAGDRALAHAWLARAYRQRGDAAAAVSHAERALALRQPLGHRLTLQLLDILAEAPEPERARHAAALRVAVARARFEESAAPVALSALVVARGQQGDLAYRSGEVDEAESAYTEVLDLSRQAVERFGESPHGLRDVSVSLNRVGDVLVQRGDVAGAEALFRESLELARRLVERFGESPEGLRDVSVSLNRVGEVALRRGDVAGAAGAFGEALELRRRLLNRYGESPDSLRDLAVALVRVGDVAGQSGDQAGARAAYEEAREHLGRLAGYGDDHAEPDLLADVTERLERLGAADRRGG